VALNQVPDFTSKGIASLMRKLLLTLSIAASLVTGSINFAVASTSSPDKKDKKEKGSKSASLYVRLGEKKAIEAVVDQFISNVASDARINRFFADTASDPKRLAKLRNNLVDQICEASGGPCKYKGKDMKTAHMGMGISAADFGALVEDLVKALDKFNVSETEKNELLGALGPMKGDIVEK
jgi:hemoglobin